MRCSERAFRAFQRSTRPQARLPRLRDWERWALLALSKNKRMSYLDEEAPWYWQLLTNEVPTLLTLFAAIGIFAGAMWLSFRTERYRHLRSVCLAASLSPFNATLAAGIISYFWRQGHFMGGSGISSPEQMFAPWRGAAIFLIWVGSGASLICLLIAIIALLLSRGTALQSK
jgi:hypothetical protein